MVSRKTGRVILFDNAGVSSSSGEAPATFADMGADAVAFIKALELTKVDLLGFSIGGFVVQEIALAAPDLVRRLVLVGTAPRGGQGHGGRDAEQQPIFGETYDPPDHLWLSVFFTPSAASQAAGCVFLKRFRLRSKGRDPEVNDKVAPRARGDRQMECSTRTSIRSSESDPTSDAGRERQHRCHHLHGELFHPAAAPAERGADDLPDSAHGSHHQYPELFVRDVSTFLSAADPWAP